MVFDEGLFTYMPLDDENEWVLELLYLNSENNGHIVSYIVNDNTAVSEIYVFNGMFILVQLFYNCILYSYQTNNVIKCIFTRIIILRCFYLYFVQLLI